MYSLLDHYVLQAQGYVMLCFFFFFFPFSNFLLVIFFIYISNAILNSSNHSFWFSHKFTMVQIPTLMVHFTTSRL